MVRVLNLRAIEDSLNTALNVGSLGRAPETEYRPAPKRRDAMDSLQPAQCSVGSSWQPLHSTIIILILADTIGPIFRQAKEEGK
jgi:hypothetical protein